MVQPGLCFGGQRDARVCGRGKSPLLGGPLNDNEVGLFQMFEHQRWLAQIDTVCSNGSIGFEAGRTQTCL